MEKKNTILLTVIAVATLLVAVVGATFAYFTATSSSDGAGSSTGAVNTATVATVKLTTADAGKSTNTVYPGTMNYAAMSVVASKSVTGTATDDTDYDVTYTVNGQVQVSAEFTAGTVSWTLYRTTQNISDAVSCDPVTQKDTSTGTQYSQTCDIDALTGASAESVGNGTVTGAGPATVSVTDQTLSTDGATTYYYYLVVSYPNQESDQNADQNKTITAELTGVTITNTAEVE